MEGNALNTLAVIITSITSVVTGAVSWMGSILTFITDNPIVYVPILLAFAGYGVGLLRRVFKW